MNRPKGASTCPHLCPICFISFWNCFYFVQGIVLRWTLSLRYVFSGRGLKKVRSVNDAKPILFLPNHPAPDADPPLLYSCLSVHALGRTKTRRTGPGAALASAAPDPVPDIRKKDDRRVALFWRPCNNAPKPLMPVIC